jgi:hypothetical protein
MSESIRTILAVAVLTSAIWVWADLEMSGDGEEQVPVKVTVPADYVVRGVSPDHLTVRFKGPKGDIQKLRAAPDDNACRFDLTEAQLKTARVTLHARDGFQHWTDHGLRLFVTEFKGDRESASDTEVIARIDHLIRVKVRVEPKVAGAVSVVAAAQPSEVTARVAESEWKALPEAKRYAVAPLTVSSIPANPVIEQVVRLETRVGGPEGIEAAFEPPLVKITARLESALVTKSLGRFPILISGPPDMLNRYRVVFQPEAERYVELEVQGPAPDIERLAAQDIRVELVLTADDKPDPASWLPGKPVIIGLPAGLKLTKPLPTVNFNLEKYGDKVEKPPTP